MGGTISPEYAPSIKGLMFGEISVEKALELSSKEE